jgi:RecA/RadA recombinase
VDFAAPRGEAEAYLVTVRVRIRVTAMLVVVDSLNERVRDYELEFGEIQRAAAHARLAGRLRTKALQPLGR